MKLLDKLFGPPSRDQYAALYMAALRKAGDTRPAQYDAKEFRLVYGKNGFTNLGNFYAEYCAAARGDRQRCLQMQVRGSLSHLKEIPADFDDAKCDLRPKLWTRSTLESLRLRQRLDGSSPPKIPTLPVGEHLEACLVYDLPEAVMSVPQGQLDDWGVSFYEAMEIARQNLESTNFAFAKIGDILAASLTGDNYDASRLLQLELIRKIDVRGEHVAMVPNRDTLLVAGSDDNAGLELMLTLADKAISEQPRPMLPMPLRLAGDEWVDWMPAEEHPLFPKFNALAVKYLYQEYAEQQQALEAIHEKEGANIFVARYSAVEKKSGEVVSYCLWLHGVEALLPQTQRIVFMRGEGKLAALGNWQRVGEVAGDLLEPTDEYPPRFRAREFPSDEQLAAIGLQEM